MDDNNNNNFNNNNFNNNLFMSINFVAFAMYKADALVGHQKLLK